MNNLDKVICFLISHYKKIVKKYLNLLEKQPTNIDFDFILGKVGAYIKVIDDLISLL